MSQWKNEGQATTDDESPLKSALRSTNTNSNSLQNSINSFPRNSPFSPERTVTVDTNANSFRSDIPTVRDTIIAGVPRVNSAPISPILNGNGSNTSGHGHVHHGNVPINSTSNGPFNSVEVVSIAVIVVLIIGLFVWHCERASRMDSKIKSTQKEGDFQRRKLRRKHSFSRSSSFASNLESVTEEPGECIFDTRLADKLNRKEADEKKRSPPFYEPWYKWLQNDSPKSNAQNAPSLERQHSSENDLELENVTQTNHQAAETELQVIGHRKATFNPPTAPQSYLITVSKHELETTMPKSLSFDSYL